MRIRIERLNLNIERKMLEKYLEMANVHRLFFLKVNAP